MWEEINKILDVKRLSTLAINKYKRGVCPLCDSPSKFYYDLEEMEGTDITVSIVCDRCSKHFFIEASIGDIYKIGVK